MDRIEAELLTNKALNIIKSNINPQKAVKYLKDSLLRYRGMTINDKTADEIARHIAAIITELEEIAK